MHVANIDFALEAFPIIRIIKRACYGVYTAMLLLFMEMSFLFIVLPALVYHFIRLEGVK